MFGPQMWVHIIPRSALYMQNTVLGVGLILELSALVSLVGGEFKKPFKQDGGCLRVESSSC